MAHMDFPEMLILVSLAAAGLAAAGALVVYNCIHPHIHSTKQEILQPVGSPPRSRGSNRRAA
jgi:hypothetical protein